MLWRAVVVRVLQYMSVLVDVVLLTLLMVLAGDGVFAVGDAAVG